MTRVIGLILIALMTAVWWVGAITMASAMMSVRREGGLGMDVLIWIVAVVIWLGVSFAIGRLAALSAVKDLEFKQAVKGAVREALREAGMAER